MQVRENLELSFVQEAEMVFTTLSSTGRKIFGRLENAFENVLVDEAAQASEIAILQPLTLGCTRYHNSLLNALAMWNGLHHILPALYLMPSQ